MRRYATLIAAGAVALVAVGILVPQHADAVTKIQPANVALDKSCGGSLRTKLVTGINLAGKYGKLSGTHRVTVFCDHGMGKDGADGTYSPDRDPAYGDRVTINAKTGFAAMVVVHELGHYLDFERYGYDPGTPVKVSAKRAAGRQAVRHAAAKSYAVATWADCMVESEQKDSRDWCAYELDGTEIFARGYAQYVAMASGDKTMLHQVKTYSDGQAHWGYAVSQGHADDFTASGLYAAYNTL